MNRVLAAYLMLLVCALTWAAPTFVASVEDPNPPDIEKGSEIDGLPFDKLYWKMNNYYINQLHQTNKDGSAWETNREANWKYPGDHYIVAMDPYGDWIFEAINSDSIRIHNAATGEVHAVRVSGMPSYSYPLGCDSQYLYMAYHGTPARVHKWRLSDWQYMGYTTLSTVVQYQMFGVANDTVWAGDGTYYYGFPTSAFNGGTIAPATTWLLGAITNGQWRNIIWDGSYYYVVAYGYSSYNTIIRRFPQNRATYTNYTLSKGTQLIPMAVSKRRAYDMATIAIQNPQTYQVQGTYTPRAFVRNIGTAAQPQQFHVKMTIGAVYVDSVLCPALAAGDTKTLFFTPWTVNSNSIYAAKCSCKSLYDDSRSNDVRRLDLKVGITRVLVTADGNVNQYQMKWWADSIMKYYPYDLVVDTFSTLSPLYRRLSASWLSANYYKAVLLAGNASNSYYQGESIATWMERGGGGVVWAPTYYYGSDYGRLTSRYTPRQSANVADSTGFLGVVSQPNHPIMDGITSIFVGGRTNLDSVVQHTTAYTVASFAGSNRILVACNETLQRRTVMLGIPPFGIFHSVLMGDSWRRLSRNALIWAAGGAHDAHDVGTGRIVAPVGAWDSGSVVTPQAWLRNYGAFGETFQSKMTIGPDYEDYVSATLSPGDSVLKSFRACTLNFRNAIWVKCSTRLGGDENPTNDWKRDSILIRIRDIGVTAITVPRDTEVHTVPFTPTVQYRNFGNTAETFKAHLVIDSYHDSATVTLAAGATTLKYFSQTAVNYGSHTARSYTVLAGDINPTNDTIVKPFVAVRHDVGVTAVLHPTGNVWRGVAQTPRVRIRNFGDARESFRVRMRITSAGGTQFYRDSIDVTLNAGDSASTNFPRTWTPESLGGYNVIAYSMLGIDQNLANDTAKATGNMTDIIHDVGVSAVVAPLNRIDTFGIVIPKATVVNSGEVTEMFWAIMKITRGPSIAYVDSSLAALIPGGTATIDFPAWNTTRIIGTYTARCSTVLRTDINRANDTASRTFLVQPLVHDLALRAIISPRPQLDTITPVIPQVAVKNYGEAAEVFWAHARVRNSGGNTVYRDSARAEILPGDSIIVALPAWSGRRALGDYALKCSCSVRGDTLAANDTLGRVLSVVTQLDHDVGAFAVVAPTGIVDSNTTITPRVTVRNGGGYDETFSIVLRIGNRYSQIISRFLNAGGDSTYSFPAWTATERGALAVVCSTMLANDVHPGNDKTTGAVTVNVHDAGLVQFISPDTVTPPGLMTPQVLLRNWGTVRDSLRLTIRLSSDSEYYSTVFLPAGLPNRDTVVRFAPDWPAVLGNYVATCTLYQYNDQQPLNNSLTLAFEVAVRVGSWVAKTNLPAGPKNRNVKDGGSLAYAPDLDGGTVYALKGNNTMEFYAYNTTLDAWTTRDSVPAIGSSGRKKTVKKGACLTVADGEVYAAKGNSSLEFWRYSPVDDGYAWLQLADVPNMAKPVKEGSGAVSVKLGDTAYVYFMKGSATTEFYRYNTLSNAWEVMSDAPLGTSGKTFKNGSGLTISSDGSTIYALKATYNEFFSYDVGTDAWTQLASMPLTGSSGKKKKVKDGAGMDYQGREIYALKGNNTDEYWCYRVDSNLWRESDPIPTGSGKKVRGGGALVTAGSVYYAFKGNNTLEFYQYTPAFAQVQTSGSGLQSGSSFRIPQSALRIVPNPSFRNPQSAIRIECSLPRAGDVSLKLYDITGKLVATLAEGYRTVGSSAFSIQRSAFSSGIYLLTFETGGSRTTTKLVIE